MQSDDDLLVVDPAVSNGRERSVRGTRVGVTTVLHLMARMGSAQAVVEYLSSFSTANARRLSKSDVVACIRYAAMLTRARTLSPPATARFQRDLDLDQEGFLAVVTWASAVLDAAADESSLDSVVAGSPDLDGELATAALDYAAALAADERLPVAEDDDDWLALRASAADEDLARIEDFCAYHTSIGLGLRVPTPAYWARMWSDLVQETEKGYGDEIDELTNSLDARDLLEDLLSVVSVDSQGKMRGILLPWDTRYFEATTNSWVSLMGANSQWSPRSWWWYRIPVKHGPALAEDLVRLRIISTNV